MKYRYDGILPIEYWVQSNVIDSYLNDIKQEAKSTKYNHIYFY